MFWFFIVLIIFIVFILFYYYYDTIMINYMIFMIVNRGLVSPNCLWWNISSMFLKDASSINLYYKLKKQSNSIIPVSMMGERIYLVTNIDYIKIILDNSPYIFGVGKFKYDLFKLFMPYNVGVSFGKNWEIRRHYNEQVLGTGHLHPDARWFHQEINKILNRKFPTEFTEFMEIGQLITMKIVFNRNKINSDVFKIFSDANSMKAFLFKNFKINPTIWNKYWNFIQYNVNNPSYPSLTYLAVQYNNDPEIIKISNQIPHWIFPIVSQISINFPRLLLLLCNHPHIFNKLLRKIREIDLSDPFQIYHLTYLRYCILELLRLNNSVVTTFRTLLQNFTFGDKMFNKGDQFLILNNPILRDPTFFKNPNQYIPERWSPEMENSYYAIMFSQGPQKCPGKDLAIFIIQSFTISYLAKSRILKEGIELLKCKKINTNYIPQMINPCDIKFYFNSLD